MCPWLLALHLCAGGAYAPDSIRVSFPNQVARLVQGGQNTLHYGRMPPLVLIPLHLSAFEGRGGVESPKASRKERRNPTNLYG